MTTRRATCACGQLTATCEGEPIRGAICHCHACKRLTGSAFSWNMRWPEDRVTLAGDWREWVRTGDEGGTIRNRFCPDCGVTVVYALSVFPGDLAIRAGCLADEDLPAPQLSVYDPSRRVAWLDVTVPDLRRLD